MDDTPTNEAPLRLPEELPGEGILVGWSLEHEHARQPIGFSYGDARRTPRSGYLDPILYDGVGHLMTVAPTGAGKGVGCVVPTLLRYPGSVIVVDPKGENYAVTARRRREMGQRVVVLDPFKLTGEKYPDTLNPLDAIVPDDPDAAEQAGLLAEMLVDSGLRSLNDPFWDDRAEQLLASLILFVSKDYPNALRHLGEVRHLLNQPVNEMNLTAKEMATRDDPEVKAGVAILSNQSERTTASIVATAQRHLQFLRGQRTAQALYRSTFDPAALADGEPMSVYIVIPPERLQTHSRLLRLWIGQLMQAFFQRRSPPGHPALFVLDEAAQLGRLRQLGQAMTLLRGYGLQTWTFWQDWSQLRHLYADSWETLLNNCKVLQSFGFANRRGARATCDITGFYDDLALLDLDADELLLMIAGDEAVIAQRPNYLTDPAFASLADPNPWHDPADDDEVAPRQPQRHYRRPGAAADKPGNE